MICCIGEISIDLDAAALVSLTSAGQKRQDQKMSQLFHCPVMCCFCARVRSACADMGLYRGNAAIVLLGNQRGGNTWHDTLNP